MLGYFITPLRSKKYYMKIFYHLIDLCVVNAWLLYRRVHPSEPYLPLVDFKILISEVLCEIKRTTPKRKGRPTAEENRTQGLIDKKKGDHALNFQQKMFVWMVWTIIPFTIKEVAASIQHVKIKLYFIVPSVNYLYVLMTKEIVFCYSILSNFNDY